MKTARTKPNVNLKSTWGAKPCGVGLTNASDKIVGKLIIGIGAEVPCHHFRYFDVRAALILR
jgi:hypothetical protein